MVSGHRRNGDVPVVGHPPPGFTRFATTHGCHSDRGPAAVLADDRNGGRFQLNASRQDDDDDDQLRFYGQSYSYSYRVTLFNKKFFSEESCTRAVL